MVQEESCVVQWEGSQPLQSIPDQNFAVFMLEEIGRIAAEDNSAVAVVDAETGKKRTYRELFDLVPRVSAGLAKAGVGLGDRVICYSLNDVDYALVFLAVTHRGATVVHLSPIYEKLQDDLLHGIKVSGATWAVVHSDLLPQAEAAFSQLPPNTIKKVWVIGDDGDASNILDLACNDPIPPITQEHGLDPSTTLSQMPFSSGSTGPRKGVMISHRNEVSRMIMMKHLADTQDWFTAAHHSKCLLVTSLSHVYSHIFLFSTFMFGGTCVVIPHFSFTLMLEAIQKHQVSMAIFTPTYLKMLVEAPEMNPSLLPSLQAVTSSGMPLTVTLAKSFRKKVGASVHCMYGMTELGSIATSSLVTEEWKSFCIGKIIPFFEAKVISRDDGKMLSAGQYGELCFRSPISMLGYTDNPAATSSTIDAEGWIRTGDYGFYDTDGFLYLADRIKDLLKVGIGLQLQPSELQDILLKHPDVDEAVVIGVPNENAENPRAFVVLKPESSTNPEVLQQYVNDRVPDFKHLTGGVWVVKHIPKNMMGKVLKSKLKNYEVEQIASC